MKKTTPFVLSLFFLFVFMATACSTGPSVKETTRDWGVRSTFERDGETIWTVFPDPALAAGKPFGYVFHFTEPFDTFKGKELAIYAHHNETGEELEVVSPRVITEPSSGYPGLERFTADFEIPRGGLWRYEVRVNKEFYADAVFRIKDEG